MMNYFDTALCFFIALIAHDICMHIYRSIEAARFRKQWNNQPPTYSAKTVYPEPMTDYGVIVEDVHFLKNKNNPEDIFELSEPYRVRVIGSAYEYCDANGYRGVVNRLDYLMLDANKKILL